MPEPAALPSPGTDPNHPPQRSEGAADLAHSDHRRGDSPGVAEGDQAIRPGVDTATFSFRPLLLLAITVFIDLLGFGIVLPNMPRYIETAVGTDHEQAAAVGGLLAASYSFTQFLFAPLWGRYSDRAGRRPVILLSLVGVAIAYVLFGLAENHLWMLFAARLLAGLLSSASIGVAFAYVADVTTPENRARGMGVLGACFGLGFILGPVVGGVLGHYSLGLPAFVAAGMALLNGLFALRYLPESLSPEERARAAAEQRSGGQNGASGYLPTLLMRALRGPAGFLFALTFLITFAFSALEQTFGFYLLSVPALGVTPERQPLVMGALLGIAGIVGVIVQGGLIGRLVPRFGEGALVAAGIALMAAGFALFPLAQNVTVLALGPMLLLSLGRPLAAPALSALLSRKTDVGQGLTLSLSQSFDALARTVGPVLGGALFSVYGPPAPYRISSLVLAAALLLALARLAHMRRPMGNGEAPPTMGR
jgi:MFS family permease